MTESSAGTTGLWAAVELPERGVSVQLSVEPGETCALIGPNGAGKSSVLATIVGALPTGGSRIALNGRLLAGHGVRVPIHRRRLGWLAQRPLLFDHLDVLDNVAFGVTAISATRADGRRRARRELEAVGIGHLAGRQPSELSGGQAQRVALARCLATDPEAVLLDEPLAAIDVPAAADLRGALADRLRSAGCPTLLATHDLLDVWRLADRVIVLDGGRVIEQGPVADVLRRPRHDFLAHLGGRNLIAGRADAGAVVRAGDLIVHGRPDEPLTLGRATLALIEPSAISVHRTLPEGSPRNVWSAEVAGLVPRIDAARVTCRALGHRLTVDLTMAAVAELGLAVGDRVWLSVKASQVLLYPR